MELVPGRCAWGVAVKRPFRNFHSTTLRYTPPDIVEELPELSASEAKKQPNDDQQVVKNNWCVHWNLSFLPTKSHLKNSDSRKKPL